MYGISCDTIRREYKTKNSKGPAPYWGHDSEKFRFRKIVAPQMAMIRLSVYDDVRNKVSFNLVSFFCLNKNGYRNFQVFMDIRFVFFW